MSLSPRIKHNSELCDKLIHALDVRSRYPKVTEQLEVFPIEPGRLVRFGYNPSIVGENGGLVMAYRFHDGDTLQTRIALAQIDSQGKVLSNRSIAATNGASMEDPRLFYWQNKLWLAYVESTWPTLPLCSTVKYGPLVEGALISSTTPKLKNPQPMEKNWVPFPGTDGVLRFIYRTWPEQVILQCHDNGEVSELRSKGFRWPWGEPRGGSTPIPWRGRLLRFFHSGLDNEFQTQRRRYFVGACLMDTNPPYQPLACSSHPILCGSELDDLVPAVDGKCKHRKPQVVFPGGAVPADRGFLLSVGVNDCQSAIVRISESDLNL